MGKIANTHKSGADNKSVDSPENAPMVSHGLATAVENWNIPEWTGGGEFYTRGDCEQFLCGLLAASLIENKPALIFDLRKALADSKYHCRGVDMMEEVLEGEDPLNEFLKLLRSRGSWGQMIRSVFPWLAIASKETWENADKLAGQLAGKGWCKLSDLGGPELTQSDF